MIKVIKVLMDYGMDFQYENRGSEGEEIMSYELGAEISCQHGIIYFMFEGEAETTRESDAGFEYIAQLVEDACINETASF